MPPASLTAIDPAQIDWSLFTPAEKLVVEEYLRRKALQAKGQTFLDYVAHVAPYFVFEEIHVLIARHFEKLRAGEIDRLMISMAPRAGKSLLTSELLPAWWMGHFPKDKIIHASYASTLVEKFGRKIRNQITDPAYQDIFPGTQIARDSRSAGQWATAQGGEYNAIGVGSGAAGKGANLACVDDIVSEQDMFSKATHDNVYEWYQSGLYSRRQPERNAFVIMMCMTGETPVLMADGVEKPLRELRSGDLVASYSDGRVVTSKVNNHRSSGVDDVYEVTTRSGRMFRANERHPFLVRHGEQLLWTRLQDLRVGDALVSLRELPPLRMPLRDTSEFTTDPIVSIAYDGVCEVFDVEIEHTENFIACGVVSHNTRWRPDDLCGRLLADAATNPHADQWVNLSIPAILDQASADLLNQCSSDPHIRDPIHYKAGDSFSPRRWPLAELMRTKHTLGRKAFSSLYQQAPVAEGGNIIHTEWWKPWKADAPLPRFEFVLQSYDTAFEEGESNDYSARVTLGVFKRASDGRLCVLVLERLKERLSFPRLLDAALESFKEYTPDRIVIEKAASGIPLIQEMRRRGIPVSPIAPKGSKVARANAAAISFEQGVVYYPEGRRWAQDLIDECAAFPNAAHDDLSDAMFHGVNFFRRMFLLETPEDEEDEDTADSLDKPAARGYAVRRSRVGLAA